MLPLQGPQGSMVREEVLQRTLKNKTAVITGGATGLVHHLCTEVIGAEDLCVRGRVVVHLSGLQVRARLRQPGRVVNLHLDRREGSMNNDPKQALHVDP